MAEAASSELPEVAQKFRLVNEAVPYLAFRTAARSMLAEAESHRDLLVKHGLLDSSIQSLSQSLTQFEQAVEQGNAGRRTHVGASAELAALAEELVQVVRLMDGANRYRFAEDAEALAAWESAINTFAPSRSSSKPPASGTPPLGGEIKPAA